MRMKNLFKYYIFLLFLISCSSQNVVKNNYAPVISSISLSNNIRPGDEGVITVTASDEEGGSLAYSFEFVQGSGVLKPSGNKAVVSIDKLETNIVRVIVTDSYGAATSGTIELYVGNRAPIIYNFVSDKQNISKGEDVSLSVLANDPDGDSLACTYEIVSGDGTIDVDVETFTATYTAGTTHGTKEIAVYATDTLGAISTKSTVKLEVYGSWVKLGDEIASGIDYASAVDSVLKIDSQNVPYVYYKTTSNTHHIKKLNSAGTGWESLTTPSFPSDFDDISMVFDSQDNLYVSIKDQSDTSDDVNVFKYNGSSWTQVLSSQIEDDIYHVYAIRADKDGNVYIAYSIKSGDNAGIYVKKYNGNTWQAVGTVITYSAPSGEGLHIDKNDRLYVIRYAGSYRVSYWYFDGSEWVMSNDEFYQGINSPIDIAFGNNGLRKCAVSTISFLYANSKMYGRIAFPNQSGTYTLFYSSDTDVDYIDGINGAFNSRDEYLIFYNTKLGSYFKKWDYTDQVFTDLETSSSITDAKTLPDRYANGNFCWSSYHNALDFEISNDDTCFVKYIDTDDNIIVRVFE